MLLLKILSWLLNYLHIIFSFHNYFKNIYIYIFIHRDKNEIKRNFIDTYKTKEINVIHNTRYDALQLCLINTWQKEKIIFERIFLPEFYYLSNRIKFSNLKALARSRWPDSRTIATSRPWGCSFNIQSDALRRSRPDLFQNNCANAEPSIDATCEFLRNSPLLEVPRPNPIRGERKKKRKKN